MRSVIFSIMAIIICTVALVLNVIAKDWIWVSIMAVCIASNLCVAYANWKQ